MKMLIVLVVMAIVSVANAANFKVEKVKTLGDMKHKVIFQSRDISFDKETNLLSTLVVARWGTEVFELAQANFKCSKDLNCKFYSYKTVKMFKSCVVENESVQCEKTISGNDYSTGSYDVVVSENPDEVKGDYDHSRGNGYDYYPEFPVRDNEEFKDLF